MRKFTVKVNGKAYEVEVEESADGSMPSVQQATMPVAVSAPVAAPASGSTPVSVPVAGGGSPVKAPMPGLVLRFLVAEGATVKKNEKIIVIEAMKMETDIVAVADGTVVFTVKKGDSLDTGTVMALIR